MKKNFNIEFNGKTIPVSYYKDDHFLKFFHERSDHFKYKTLAIDLETYPLEEYKDDEEAALTPVKSNIRTLQFYDGDEVVILDFMEKDNWNYLNHLSIFSFLYYMLLKNKLIAHNALFETMHLQNIANRHGIKEALTINCTMNMYRLLIHSKTHLTSKYKASLAEVVDNTLGIEIPKEMQRSDWSVPELTKEQLEYCAIDAVAPYDIAMSLVDALEEEGLDRIYKLTIGAQDAIASMHNNGLCVDVDKHNELSDEWDSLKAKNEIDCFKLFNKDKINISFTELKDIIFNKVDITIIQDYYDSFDLHTLEEIHEEWKKLQLKQKTIEDKKLLRAVNRIVKNLKEHFINSASCKQISEWLLEHLDKETLDNWPRSEKSKHLKLDIDVLNLYSDIEFVKPLSDYKKYSKLASNYGSGLKKHIVKNCNHSTIHPNFSLGFVGTGRLSSYKPNLQNQPRIKELRAVYIARGEDYKLLRADLSQIEIRCAAYISNDSIMKGAYEKGQDIHKVTASLISGKHMANVSSQDRQLAKAINFGLLFGAGAATLQKYAKKQYGVTLTIEEANDAVQRFRQTYPEYRKWQVEQSSFDPEEETYKVSTPTGKIRALNPEKYYTTSLNTPIQGAAAEIILWALTYLDEYLRKTGFEAYIVNCIHDEIIVDCHTDYITEISNAIVYYMEKALLTIFPEATTKNLVEVDIRDNWAGV